MHGYFSVTVLCLISLYSKVNANLVLQWLFLNKVWHLVGRNCALMMGTPGRNKGQWSAGVCDAKFGYICEKLGTVRKTTPPSRRKHI